jgi:prepilin-type N-terminal cleavage/methylation domain-containing protein
MKKTMPSRRTAACGFTLVEVLVSISILGLMMVGVAQMLNSAMSATLGGYKHMDADTQARMVLDRMAYDISRISRRTDVDYYLKTSTTVPMAGNDQMAFFSESSGYYPNGATSTQQSTFSLVGYRINSSYQLERLNKSLIWNGASATDSQTGATTPTPMVFGAPASFGTLINTNWSKVEGSGADPDYQVIGDQIFRLEYCFLVESSATGNTATVTASNLTDTPYVSPNTTYNGLQDVVAIVVSVAVLDSQSQAIATKMSPTAMATAATKLDDVSGATIATNKLPLTLWKADLAANHLGLPATAASQVRFYQRYCYINHAQ